MAQESSGARVVMLRGVGSQMLTQAIESGLVSKDVRREIDALVTDRDRLAREASALKRKLTASESLVRNYRKMHLEALVEMRDREGARKGQLSRLELGIVCFAFGSALSGIVVLLIVASMMMRSI